MPENYLLPIVSSFKSKCYIRSTQGKNVNARAHGKQMELVSLLNDVSVMKNKRYYSLSRRRTLPSY